MGEYKYYLLPTITFAYLFEFLLGVCQPIFIFPILGGYGRGFIQYTSSTVAFLCTVLLILTAGYAMLGTLYAMLYRYKIIAPEAITRWLDVKWIYRGIICYGYIGISMGICFGLYFLRPNKEKLDSFLLNNPEYMDLAKKEPTLIIFDSDEFAPSNFFYLSYVIVIFLIVFTVVLIFHFERQLYQQKSKMSPTTYKLQKMMNTCFKAELFSAHLLLLCPITTAVFVIHTKNSNGASICHGALMFGSLYSIALYSSMIYFIRPYRRFLAKFFYAKLRSNSNNTQSSIFTV
ncbi:hypothetical protein FO519_007062 [Halicephalobus sp. NKZ332]|nr:hypothetical protein FO519_007062 [Halicephalobus sp. NKZ332]